MGVTLVAMMLAQAQPAAAVAPVAGLKCELHVWGAGRPNFMPRGSFVARIDPAQLDKSNPLSNVNVFNTARRAAALPDEELRRLLPQAERVTVVRHAEMIDTDKTPLDKLSGPIARTVPGCYADLIIANLYGIFPNPDRPYQTGLLDWVVSGLIDGKDRLVIDFRFRDFSGAAPDGRIYRRKNDTPMPHVPFMTTEMQTAVEGSTVLNLRGFADYVAQQRGR